MGKLSVQARYAALTSSLEKAALDPAEWISVCDGLAELVGGVGTALIAQNVEQRAPAVPCSDSLEELHSSYIEGGWYKRDLRSAGFGRMMSIGFVTDQDLHSPDTIEQSPYYQEFLRPVGFKWFIGVGFKVGREMWAAAIQGTPQRGAFMSEDIESLDKIRPMLSLAGRQTAALGEQRLESLEQTLASAGRGMAALDWVGRIVWSNSRAEEILADADISRQGRLCSRAPLMDMKLTRLVDGALGFRMGAGHLASAPIRIRGRSGNTYVADAVPMPRDIQSVLNGVATLVTIHEVEQEQVSLLRILGEHFHLSARESELALKLAGGAAIADIAREMGVTVVTARDHLKAVFSKTGTHRQAELVALFRDL